MAAVMCPKTVPSSGCLLVMGTDFTFTSWLTDWAKALPPNNDQQVI
jgi:hypothetical protein